MNYSSLGYSEFVERTNFVSNTVNHKWGGEIIRQADKERKEREQKRYKEQADEIQRQIDDAKELKRQNNEANTQDYINTYGTNLWQPGNDYPNVYVPLSVRNIVALDLSLIHI